MIPKLVTLSQTDAIEVQREAIWSLSNCTANKVPEHIRYLVENNVVEALLSWLDKNDTKTLVVILEGLVNMLEVGTKKLQSEELQDKIRALRKEMEAAAKELNFIEAARIRDELFAFQALMKERR